MMNAINYAAMEIADEEMDNVAGGGILDYIKRTELTYKDKNGKTVTKKMSIAAAKKKIAATSTKANRFAAYDEYVTNKKGKSVPSWTHVEKTKAAAIAHRTNAFNKQHEASIKAGHVVVMPINGHIDEYGN